MIIEIDVTLVMVKLAVSMSVMQQAVLKLADPCQSEAELLYAAGVGPGQRLLSGRCVF